jgi:predicted transcriptional regulator
MAAKTINVRPHEALYDQIEALTHYVQSESWQIHDIHEGIKEADAGEFSTDEQVKSVFDKYSVRACG